MPKLTLVLTGLLLVLKLAGVTDISYWWVFSPVLFLVGLLASLLILLLLLRLIEEVCD